MSCNANFICFMGEDWERTLTIKNGDGSLTDLAGASAEMQVRTAAGGALILAVGCAIDEPTSTITLAVSNSDTSGADTAGLRLRTVTEYIDDAGTEHTADGYAAVYAIEVTFGDGKKENILRGTFCLVPEVVE